MRQHYPENYVPYHSQKTDGCISIQQKLRMHYQLKRYRLVVQWKSSGRILDIGCSTGDFLATMQSRGWQAFGVEWMPQVAGLARQQYGLDVWVGDFVDAPVVEESFDVITMWDVLEHLYFPTRALEKCSKLLVPGGILVITLPNWESWDRILFGKYWSGFDFPRHLYVFPMYILYRMIQQSGLQWLIKKCEIGSYGAWRQSFDAFLLDYAPQWRRRINDLLLRLIIKPYLWAAEVCNKGTEATIVCQKPF